MQGIQLKNLHKEILYVQLAERIYKLCQRKEPEST